jgi:hypothetical protein
METGWTVATAIANERMGIIEEEEEEEEGRMGLDSSGGSGSGLGHLLERYREETRTNIKSDLFEIENLCF